ncbi:MAG: hypothetical protein AB7J19_03625 [Beijerinckiaceae bacterium]
MSERGKLRIGKIDTLGGVIGEMGRVYREMRRGQLDTMDGKRLVDALTAIRQAMEIRDIEGAIRDMQERASGV